MQGREWETCTEVYGCQRRVHLAAALGAVNAVLKFIII